MEDHISKVKPYFWNEEKKYGRFNTTVESLSVFNKSERKEKREIEKCSREMKGKLREQRKNNEILGGKLIAFTDWAISHLELE